MRQLSQTPAVNQRRKDDVIAHLTCGHVVAGLDDDARPFVADDHGQRERQLPCLDRHVGVAEATGPDLHADVVGSDGARGGVDDLDRRAVLVDDCCFHLTPQSIDNIGAVTSPDLAEAFNTYALDPLSGEPYEIFARMREESPAMWSEPLQAWVLTRWADVSRMLEDGEHFGPLMNQPGTSSIFGRALLQMSGDEHRRKEAIIAKRIRSPKRLTTDLDELVTELVTGHGDALPPCSGEL